jgi:hypothetical protein
MSTIILAVVIVALFFWAPAATLLGALGYAIAGGFGAVVGAVVGFIVQAEAFS